MGRASGARWRRKRVGVVIVTAACVAVMAATYLLSQPPQLVRWLSPPVGNSGRHVQMLIPPGWELQSPVYVEPPPQHKPFPWHAQYRIIPRDSIPKLLRRIFRLHQEDAEVSVDIYQTQGQIPAWGLKERPIERRDSRMNRHQAYRVVLFRDEKIWAGIVYRRTNLGAFDHTYAALCNSMRVE